MGKDNIPLDNPEHWFYRKRQSHKTPRTIISSISAHWPTVRRHTSVLFNIRRASRWSCNEWCHEDRVLFLLLTIYRSCDIKGQSALTTKLCGYAWKNRQQFDNTITVHKLPVDSVKHVFPEVYSIKMSSPCFWSTCCKHDLMYKLQILEIHDHCKNWPSVKQNGPFEMVPGPC